MPMRMHIILDDELVAQVDAAAGRGGRSRFIVEAVRRRLAAEQRWESLMAAIGSIEDSGHEGDADPAAWVARQRTGDPGRVG